MIEDLLRQDRKLKRAKIIGETAKVPWLQLQRFFAAGKVMQVASELDLVDVACALEADDSEQVKTWTEALQVFPVPDEQARVWVASEAIVWAVVVKPWVLVQAPGPDT